jgi:hypothetical protein
MTYELTFNLRRLEHLRWGPSGIFLFFFHPPFWSENCQDVSARVIRRVMYAKRLTIKDSKFLGNFSNVGVPPYKMFV